jgi:hypothetical protein
MSLTLLSSGPKLRSASVVRSHENQPATNYAWSYANTTG